MASKQKSSKQKKVGRNKRAGKNTRQAARTALNKLRRINYERKKAGLPSIKVRNPNLPPGKETAK